MLATTSHANKYILNSIIDFFGKEALILNSKSKDFTEDKLVNAHQLEKMFEYLNDPICSITDNIQKLNYFSCLLYYQSLIFPYAKKHFAFVEKQLKEDCDLNENNLFLIFNIIEYEDIFHDNNTSNETKYEQLLAHLNRFENNYTNHKELLVYYKALLYFMLKRNKDCEMEIAKLNSQIKSKTNKDLISFLGIAGEIIILRLAKENIPQEKDGFEKFETRINKFFNSLFVKNPILAIKIGNYIANMYIKKLDLEKCKHILNNLKMLLQRAKFLQTSEMSHHLYIMVLFKLIYCFSLENNIAQYIEVVDLLNMAYVSEKKVIPKMLNSFIVNTYMLDNDYNIIQREKIHDKMKLFLKTFIHSNLSLSYEKFFIPDITIIKNNLFALDHNNSTSDSFKDIVNSYIDKIKNENQMILCGDLNNQPNIVNIYIYIYNLISYYTDQYLSEQNQQNKINLKNKILTIIYPILHYIHNFYKSMPSLKSYLVKNIIITFYSIYLSLCEEKKFKELQGYYETSFVKMLNVPKEFKGANGLIEKVLGDNFLKQNKYKEALERYENSLILLGDYEEEYRKGTIHFNMGVCYLMMNNKEEAMKQFEISLKIYTELKENFGSGVGLISKRCTVEFYEKKIKHVNDVIEMIIQQE